MSGNFAHCPSKLVLGLKLSCRISNKIVALAIWPMAMHCCLRLRLLLLLMMRLLWFDDWGNNIVAATVVELDTAN